MALADKMGLPKDMLHRILSNSFAQSRIYDRHYTQFVEVDNFQPGFALNLLHKDLVLVKKMADGIGAALPIGAHVEQLIDLAKANGYGEKDMSGMYLYMNEINKQHQMTK
ncbi:2-hydroxy-3-oxopropionate reductase [compost metagenome]